MSRDMERISESKRAMRRRLAALPVAEKMRMLDDLREREIALRDRSRSVRDAASEGQPGKPI